MSHKRSRANFEADLQAQQSPYVLFGTPLPPLDPEVRDDGSYVPVWKQEVRDERGRKRLHGAFTGGFSAGYFNTVGSKEGWTPSTFVSSRSDRRKDGEEDAVTKTQQRPEDFMDEEDLADKVESEKLQTANGFAGLGSTELDEVRRGGLADLFRVRGVTMGVKLLKRMGWKEGQGIGPKVRRKARLEVGDKGRGDDVAETHLFAPENVQMIAFVKKLDRKGLGCEGESKLTHASSGAKDRASESSSEDEDGGPLIRPGRSAATLGKKAKPARGGIGIGILNDNGSDDEDPYEVGPRISYNRVIGGEKKKKKAPKATSANPNLRSAPVFISKKSSLAKAGKNLRRCHDGRLPLDGFIFGTETDMLVSTISSESQYPPPKIPPGWKSSKQRKGDTHDSSYTSAADAAKASKLDPKSRAALLGEAQLPGKSVFDFLPASARDRLAAATGKTNLPPALGEIPEGYALTPEEKQRQLLAQVPILEKDTAIAVLTRGASGANPYADNEAKRGRYRAYLEYSAGFSKASLPGKAPTQSNEDWLRELREFHNCARIFKPMTGMMASRFTTSSSSKFIGGTAGTNNELLSKPAPKPTDPAEEAAKLGMYGSMTRALVDFYPTRLLCKRFNVRPPAHVQPDPEAEAATGGSTGAKVAPEVPNPANYGASGGTAITLEELLQQARNAPTTAKTAPQKDATMQKAMTPASDPKKADVDANVNEALEGKRAQDEVLRAIFGDSSDDEE
ncbi:hypothetical protein BJ170DRAFT_277799 [Xylariales sp. AK1849]|nr:hypothetical protein BJ170DRAFT_277799 [Xylariales sp. AK1849]